MKNMKKGLVMLAAIEMLVSLFSFQLEAANKDSIGTEERVEDLLDEMDRTIAEAMLTNEAQDVLSSKLENIQRKLDSYGVEEITTRELGEKLPEDCIPTSKMRRVTKPANTNNVRWELTTTHVTYNGVKYDVQKLWATGLTPQSMLCTGGDAEKMGENQNILAANIGELACIYVQKGAGMIPVLRWLPYELAFNASDGTVVNSETVYDYLTHYTISGFDKRFKKNIYVANPTGGPGQIY